MVNDFQVCFSAVVHETVEAVKISHHGVEAGDCLGESILIFKKI
jgi:hypothetical protein